MHKICHIQRTCILWDIEYSYYVSRCVLSVCWKGYSSKNTHNARALLQYLPPTTACLCATELRANTPFSYQACLQQYTNDETVYSFPLLSNDTSATVVKKPPFHVVVQQKYTPPFRFSLRNYDPILLVFGPIIVGKMWVWLPPPWRVLCCIVFLQLTPLGWLADKNWLNQ